MDSTNKKSFAYLTSKLSDMKAFIELAKEKKYLGTDICFGTYLPDNIPVDELEFNDELIKGYYEDENVAGISVCIDTNDYRNKNFGNLFGINNVIIGFIQVKDIEAGDISDNKTISLKKASKYLETLVK